YDPAAGHRFNPNKLLLDPYAKAIAGQVRWSDVVYGYRVGSPREDLAFDRRDSARHVPKCRVVETAFTWNDDRQPHTSWEETIILEMHVRGFTIKHPAVDMHQRGPFAALAAPTVIDYLVELGITALEFLPVHAAVRDRHLVSRGLSHYWGYNTIGFFAPGPRCLQMVMDSLRYWALEMHVGGFRFDLTTTLARENGEYGQGAAFFDAISQDPAMARVKLIAEPWDVGPYGYQLGNMPPGWAEWNAQYRDTVRRFWKGDKGLVSEIASRVAGSSDIFGYRGRRPWSSINFLTAHDGFTLQDLVSYNEKHNEANGEDNRDGHDPNFSWNTGVEGPSEDPAIVSLRDQQKRNLLATLLLSLGVPMLLAGDEFGHTQGGNNNAYCLDNEISWLEWENIRPEDEALREFVRYLVHVRRQHRVFSRPRFFRGEVVSEAGLKDITWVTPDGIEVTGEYWGNESALSLGYVLGGAAGEFYTRGGQRDIDESFLVMMNAYYGDLDF